MYLFIHSTALGQLRIYNKHTINTVFPLLCLLSRSSDQLLSGTLEEELDDSDLEGAHHDHQAEVEEGEPENSVFRGLDCALVSVVSGLVVVQRMFEQVQRPFDLIHRELHACDGGVFGRCVRQIGLDMVGLVLVFHLDLEVHHLFSKGGHLVVKTELVLACQGSAESVVTLSLFLLDNNQHLVWVLDGVVDVKGTPRLDSKIVADVGVRLVVELVEALLLVRSQRERQCCSLGKPEPAAQCSPSKQ